MLKDVIREEFENTKGAIRGFHLVKLKSSLRKFYGRHHDLVDHYGISVSQMTTDMSQEFENTKGAIRIRI
jgi:hypothetical protein